MDEVRIDKWLWAARFFKTRSLAAEAIDGGKVQVNGQPARRSKAVRPGDRVRLRLGPYQHVLTVRQLAERRGPAAVAVTLFEEDPESRSQRERLAEQHRLAATAFHDGGGKPSEKQRRDLRRLRGK